jgi:hypothetical protein
MMIEYIFFIYEMSSNDELWNEKIEELFNKFIERLTFQGKTLEEIYYILEERLMYNFLYRKNDQKENT